MELLRQKDYPTNYPSDVVKVLDTMTFTKGKDLKIFGTSGVRSQQFAGDYDGHEDVQLSYPTDTQALDWLVNRFKTIIKDLKGMSNVFIGDIKGGVVAEWRILPLTAYVEKTNVVGYNAVQSRKVVDTLRDAGVLTREEAEGVLRKLLPTLTPVQLIELKNELKYHIVRWTPTEIIAGSKTLADGRTFTLADGFSSPGITKLDIIALVQNSRYTEFSIIYKFSNNGKVLNPEPVDFQKAVKESILYYKLKNHPFKVLKREFSLARVEKDETQLKRLHRLLDSDLGKLYLVLSDIGTLITLLRDHTNVPLDKVRFELDQFRGRLSTIYSAEQYLRNEQTLLGDLNSAMKLTQKDTLMKRLEQIETQLFNYLEDATTVKLRGGSASYQPIVDVVSLKQKEAPGQEAESQYEAVKSVEGVLRTLAHYYRFRHPPLSLGYRVLADDIWKQIPKDAPSKTNPYDSAGDSRDLDPQHLDFAKDTAKAVIEKSEVSPFKDLDSFKTFLANADRVPKDALGNPLWLSNKTKGKIPPKQETYTKYSDDYSLNAKDLYEKLRKSLQNKGTIKLGRSTDRKGFEDLFRPGASEGLLVQRLLEVAPLTKSSNFGTQ